MSTPEIPILSVSDLSLSLKSCVEQVFGHVRVRGEVSDVKRAASGHIYFTLKDTDSVLSAVCWRGRGAETSAAIQEGLEVICTGKISTYPARSNYQMIVETAEPAGVGALLKLLNERKEKLEKEGLFDPLKKKPIPYLPRVIGVVTSPTGSVIRDIIHRISDRFPVPILLWPVLVQGDGAAEQIATAIQGFNALPTDGGILRPDVLIVARGGGSLEDLWCFNEECVVRAAAASQIPLISAVGHETDTTLIDYASDLRAPTPTGAAEKSVPVRIDLINRLNLLNSRLNGGLTRTLDENKIKLAGIARGLPNLMDIIQTFIQRIDDKSERLNTAITHICQFSTQKYENLGRLLSSYSYTEVLKRGFTLTTDPDGHIVSSQKQALKTPKLDICFFDGKVSTIPLNNNENSKPHPKKKNTQKTSNPPLEQPDLFTTA